MEFSLNIHLDDEVVSDQGIDAVLPAYLRRVAVMAGIGHADAGIVHDDDDQAVGNWSTVDTPPVAPIKIEREWRVHGAYGRSTVEEYRAHDGVWRSGTYGYSISASSKRNAKEIADALNHAYRVSKTD